jgi:hypothetical protein
MLYKNKNNVAKSKKQNGGLIQDGDDFFYLAHNKPPLILIRPEKKNVWRE